MKFFKLLFGIALITTMFTLASCGEGGLGSSSPSDVVKISAGNIADEDYDALVTLYVKKNGEALSEEEQDKVKAIMPQMKEEIDKKGGIKEVIIIEETISEDGTTATVNSQLVFGDGEKSNEDKSELLLVNGNWKIVFEIGG
ncbi:MAG: DUF4878 domain-containing protein [Ignavibacteriaceae bacterium]|nr:DUF4878 domain-containing protein [Ignavibacteriaceae bacterium]